MGIGDDVDELCIYQVPVTLPSTCLRPEKDLRPSVPSSLRPFFRPTPPPFPFTLFLFQCSVEKSWCQHHPTAVRRSRQCCPAIASAVLRRGCCLLLLHFFLPSNAFLLALPLFLPSHPFPSFAHPSSSSCLPSTSPSSRIHISSSHSFHSPSCGPSAMPLTAAAAVFGSFHCCALLGKTTTWSICCSRINFVSDVTDEFPLRPPHSTSSST